MMIAIIVLLVVLLVTIGLGFYFMFTNLGKSPDVEETEKEIAVEDVKPFNLTDSIYTNLLNGTDNKEHVVKLNMSLGIDNSDEKDCTEFITMLTENEVVVKDVVISTLKKKTFEELKKSDSLEVLRDELLGNLQKQFNSNLIAKVYISEFFVQ